MSAMLTKIRNKADYFNIANLATSAPGRPTPTVRRRRRAALPPE